MHELRPATEDRRIRRKNGEALRHTVKPSLDFPGFLYVLLSRYLYPRLYFAHGDGRNVQQFRRRSLNPLHYALVRLNFAKLGNNVGIEEIHVSIDLELPAP